MGSARYSHFSQSLLPANSERFNEMALNPFREFTKYLHLLLYATFNGEVVEYVQKVIRGELAFALNFSRSKPAQLSSAGCLKIVPLGGSPHPLNST
jgi:hypothetical protein